MQHIKWSGNFLYLITILLFLGSYNQAHSNEDTIALNYNVIPKPSQLIIKEGKFALDKGVDFQHPRELDIQAIELLQFFKKHQIKSSNIYSRKLIFDFAFEKHDAESYRLKITKDTILLTANTPIGISRGSATLKQLMLLNNHSYYDQIPLVEIFDAPRFEHRGLLLDCSRHFFSVKTVKKYIDLLALYKMNTLHWHLTEDQGWRIAIDKYPKLASIAAYRTEVDGSKYGGLYSKEEIRDVVQYAAKKHITIIPEIELPGHSQAAIAAYPQLSCTGKLVEVANDWGVFKEIYCAGNDSVFSFLEDVLTEVIDLFPSKYIHIGGDEAPKVRWEKCEKCQKRMQEHNLKDEHELQSYFIKRIQGFLNSKGKEIIGWDEILEGGLTKGAVVQSWRGMEGGIAAARQGNKVIMSPTSHAYLDYDLKSIDLKKIYNFNPIPQGLEIENRSYIIGAECNIWTEHVPDEKTLDQKVFPRMIGMSEALWSDEKKDYKDFNRRIQSHYPILEFYKVQYGEEEIPFSYQTKIQNDSLYLVLTAASDQLTLNYNYKNDTNSLVYDTPILLNSSESINVQAYKNNQRYGEKNEIPLSKHKALNSQVSYASAFNKWYTAGGENALVDSKLGTLDFKDGNWQGFWGTDVDISIQLKPLSKD
ncbi:MAG: beta-N-acetylhexosaminidase [Flavobacteriales bacterium]|nr:beta-N-acetylhexosaminidase [Flavobacteriales bacterium]